jgi:putative ABC transport system ATP-binding protein
MLHLEGLTKIYRTEDVETHALSEISLDIARGEFVAIMGPSGCGKSTLLNILGLLDSPSAGSYRFEQEDIAQAPQWRLTALRRAAIGFVFQDFNLIDDLTVEENVAVALIYRGVSAAERRQRVKLALEQVDMSHRARHLPARLSGGQQQRVAIARALVSNPTLILADEPTGNLDSSNGDEVMRLLVRAVEQGTTVVMVTHSLSYASFARRTVRLLDGRLVSETTLAS